MKSSGYTLAVITVIEREEEREEGGKEEEKRREKRGRGENKGE